MEQHDDFNQMVDISGKDHLWGFGRASDSEVELNQEKCGCCVLVGILVHQYPSDRLESIGCSLERNSYKCGYWMHWYVLFWRVMQWWGYILGIYWVLILWFLDLLVEFKLIFSWRISIWTWQFLFLCIRRCLGHRNFHLWRCLPETILHDFWLFQPESWNCQ